MALGFCPFLWRSHGISLPFLQYWELLLQLELADLSSVSYTREINPIKRQEENRQCILCTCVTLGDRVIEGRHGWHRSQMGARRRREIDPHQETFPYYRGYSVALPLPHPPSLHPLSSRLPPQADGSGRLLPNPTLKMSSLCIHFLCVCARAWRHTKLYMAITQRSSFPPLDLDRLLEKYTSIFHGSYVYVCVCVCVCVSRKGIRHSAKKMMGVDCYM